MFLFLCVYNAYFKYFGKKLKANMIKMITMVNLNSGCRNMATFCSFIMSENIHNKKLKIILIPRSVLRPPDCDLLSIGYQVIKYAISMRR
jgi:hypothetical protein